MEKTQKIIQEDARPFRKNKKNQKLIEQKTSYISMQLKSS